MVGTGPDSDGELRARGDRSRTVGLVFGPAGGAACVAACANLAAHGVTAHICGERSGNAQSWQVQAGVQPPVDRCTGPT